MPRPDLTFIPEWYHNYIKCVEEDDLMDALRKQTPHFLSFLESIPVEKREYSYATEKWTIKTVLQHIIDAERIFIYRALCFARKDTTSLPGFDEKTYANNSNADKRDWDGMVEEFKAVRKSTALLFGSLTEEQLQAAGIANGNSVYVEGIGFIIVGHAKHHENVIIERYL